MLVEKFKVDNYYYTRKELSRKYKTQRINSHGDLFLESKDGSKKFAKTVRSEMVPKGTMMA